jgi:hypothetical protein
MTLEHNVFNEIEHVHAREARQTRLGLSNVKKRG